MLNKVNQSLGRIEVKRGERNQVSETETDGEREIVGE